MRIESISGSSSKHYVLWQSQIQEAIRIRKVAPAQQEFSEILGPPERKYANQKQIIREVYIIGTTLTIPEHILYEGKGDAIYGIPRNKLQSLDHSLHQLPDHKLHSGIIRVTAESIDNILQWTQNKDQTELDPELIESLVLPGMMTDQYL